MGGKCSCIRFLSALFTAACQVAEIVGITRANGWVQPKIYQA
jgi:hypothetical protein